MQKISKDTWQRKDRAEPEGYVGGQTYMRITENNLTNVDRPQHVLLEEILSPKNLNKAYRRVKGNNGAGGVDGMGKDELLAYLTIHKEELLESILNGRYRPNPVRRVEIPKDNGKKRQLGIPTVVDRVIQQAIAQILSPLFEKQFSATSYGFRPKRSAHQALRKCQEFIDEGNIYAIDMDLEKFFDTVNQSKLVEVLSRTIKDGRVISFIHKYLRAGAVVRNTFEETDVGVPQGGPLSPLLSNIMLNELDKELERRGHRFARYADDCVIFCKSKRSAERTLANILPFIEQKLFLKVNREEMVVAYVRNIKFLGYSKFKAYLFTVFIAFLLITMTTLAAPKKNVEALRIQTPLTIDAVLNEAVYSQVSPAADFTQLQPYNGKPSMQPTKAWFFYDENAIYVGAMLYDSAPDSIFNYLSERDNIGTSDYFGVYFDPYNQGQLSYGFFLTPAGVQVDIKAIKTSEGDNETSSSMPFGKARPA